MEKDIGMRIRKSIVVSFLPCLIAFLDSIPILYLFISKTFFMTCTVCGHLNYATTFSPLVTITVDYTTPPDFPFPPGSNEYRTASGPLVYTCRVDGEVATGVAWTSDCDCPLASSTTNPIARFALTSGDTGTHTCTVSAGSASITVNIVGKWP